jgi:Zinc finger, C2H2 type
MVLTPEEAEESDFDISDDKNYELKKCVVKIERLKTLDAIVSNIPSEKPNLVPDQPDNQLKDQVSDPANKCDAGDTNLKVEGDVTRPTCDAHNKSDGRQIEDFKTQNKELDKSFKCSQCDAIFDSDVLLQSHIRVMHSDDIPEREVRQKETHQGVTHKSETHQSVTRKSETQQIETYQSVAHKSETRQSERHHSVTHKSETQQSERHQSVTHKSETQQSKLPFLCRVCNTRLSLEELMLHACDDEPTIAKSRILKNGAQPTMKKPIAKQQRSMHQGVSDSKLGLDDNQGSDSGIVDDSEEKMDCDVAIKSEPTTASGQLEFTDEGDAMQQILKATAYACSICDRRFKYKGDLVHHTLIVHEKKMLPKCDICGKLFKDVRRHQVTIL